MKQAWHPDELTQHWTLSDDECRLLGEKTGATRLAFAVLLKAFQYEGRFPICAYLQPFPTPTASSCHLLLAAEAWARSLCQPCPHRAFLMPSTPRPAAEKALQTGEARLEAGLRPPALHLLPQRIQPQPAQQPTAHHDALG